MKRLPTSALLALAVCQLAPPAPAGDWPGWRGPYGTGRCDERGLPLAWDAKRGENIAWKAQLRGETYASPIVRDGRVFVALAAAGGPRPDDPKKKFADQQVVCFDAVDGRELWRTRIDLGPERQVEPGYRAATPTPVADGRRVYAWFGSAVLVALDAGDGVVAWRREFPGPYALNPTIASSPVLFGDTVLVLCDQSKDLGFLTAVGRETGEVRWTKPRAKLSHNNGTPVLAQVDGRPQLLVNASKALQGVDPATGEVIWWCDGKVGFGASVAYDEADGGRVYADAGQDGGSQAVCVEPGGTGDVTAAPRVRWRLDKVGAAYGSPVIAGGYVLRARKPDLVDCRRLETGELAWSERLEGVSFITSPVVTADGLVYFVGGKTSHVIRPGPTLEVVGTGTLTGGDRGSPAVSDGRIFVIAGNVLYCIGKRG